MRQKKSSLFILTVVVIIAWGIVPALATVGDLPAGITTFLVNAFSALALAVMISFGVFDKVEIKNLNLQKDNWVRRWGILKNYDLKRYMQISILGICWPFVYSLAYFHSIYIKQASLVVLFNFTWPLFCVIGLFFIYKKRFKLISFLGILISVFAAIFYVFSGNSQNEIVYLMLGLGLIVAITQGLYTAITDGGWWKDINPGVITFIGACVTTILSLLFIIFFGELKYINQISLWPIISLAIVGIFSNGLGFSAFLLTNQMTSGETEDKLKTKAIWLVSLSLIPFAQMLFLLLPFDALRDKVTITGSSWVALFLLMFSFIILKMSNWYEDWKKRKNISIDSL